MEDFSGSQRKRLAAYINMKRLERDRLSERYSDIYNSDELTKNFRVESFAAPFVLVTRKEDGQRGTLLFQHHPRFYFQFKEDPADV